MAEHTRAPALVTGAAGYIGRHVVRRLAERGHPVTAVDNLSSPNSGSNLAGFDHERVKFQQVDVADGRQMQPLVRRHPIVVHLASIVGIQAVINEPRAMLDQLSGIAAIADSLTAEHALLLASTSDIYGLHSVLHDDAPIREDDLTVLEPPQVLRWSYAHMKALAESVFAGTVARAVGVRIFNCYGPGMDFPQPRRVIPIFASRIVQGQPLQISGDGSQQRAYCHVDDIVSGIVASLDYIAGREAGAYEAINLGNPQGQMSVLDLAKTMVNLAVEHRLTSHPVEILTDHALYSAPFNDRWHRSVDISKARQLLDFDPQVPLEEGLVQVLSFVAEHADKPTTHSANGQPRAIPTQPGPDASDTASGAAVDQGS